MQSMSLIKGSINEASSDPLIVCQSSFSLSILFSLQTKPCQLENSSKGLELDPVLARFPIIFKIEINLLYVMTFG